MPKIGFEVIIEAEPWHYENIEMWLERALENLQDQQIEIKGFSIKRSDGEYI